jgi:hypothetical protein
MSKRRRPRKQASRRAYLKKHSTRFNPIWRKLANDVPFDPTSLNIRENETTWKSDFAQGIDEWYTVKLNDGKYNKLFMKFSGNKFFFEQYYFSSYGEVKTISIVYPNRDMAMLRYNTNTIHWLEGETTESS